MNTDTKRHIDSARQVLVGVVPNPTSQIDQITNALIYKFMDDMDQAAIKQGDEPSFFVGDLENYAWTRLMDPRMGNQERMNLYGEALIKFSQANQLPELFRGIFKSAFLPYRSPETLGLFLKEIDYFDYSHPEELGNAYEYLLSIMSSQGDAGQFRTPRHIIDFIVDVVNPTKDDKVLDPACGTGGFLVSSYTHILDQHDGKGDQKKKEKPLTPEERKKLMANFEGYDIDPTMARIAQVNMYLHQFKNPKIFQYDTLTSDERWNEKFDVILANPPFMSPQGGIRPHDKFSIESSRSEVLFVDYIMNHLKPKGRAGIIVPEGIIFQSGTAHKQLRKNLIKDGLYAIISLPSGVFAPYSGVKTSLLLFDNDIAKKTKHILFIKINNDGFDLGAQRRSVTGSDLPLALEVLNRYKKHSESNGSNSVRGWPDGEHGIDTFPNCQFVSKEEIAKNGDYNLSGDRYRVATDYSNAKWPMVKLEDICSLESGSRDKGGAIDKGIYSIGGQQISEDNEIRFGKMKYITEEHFLEMKKGVLHKGDVLMVKDGATTGKMAFWNYDYKAAVNEHVFILRHRDLILPKYLYAVLRSDPFQYELKPYIKGIIGGISLEIKKIKIPLPPLEIQEQIVAELNSYDSIIAGSKQIALNWKPKIEIDSDWPKVKLGKIAEYFIGLTYSPEDVSAKGTIVLRSSNIQNGELDFSDIVRVNKKIKENLIVKDGDILMCSRNGSKRLVGKIAVIKNLTEKMTFGTFMTVIRSKHNQFLSYFFVSDLFRDQISESETSSINQITKYMLNEVVVPLPPFSIQKKIAEKVEAERQFVESSKKLIEIYELKIKVLIDKLWDK